MTMSNLCVVGLRRSGSTIFWETFRQDSRLVAFDEPFNANLDELPAENIKNTRAEFIDVYSADPAAFRDRFAPILPESELDPSVTRKQSDYLKWLMDRERPVVVDLVRVNFKLDALSESLGDARVLHLHRSPIAWASSHLLPSGKGTWKRRYANAWRRASFWHRRGFYNSWHYEEIIGRMVGGPDGRWLETIGLPVSEFARLPAYGRLMAFWYLAYRTVEESGRKCFGSRFSSVRLEDFCADPRTVTDGVYRQLGAAPADLDFSRVHRAADGHRPRSRRWVALAKKIGIPEELLVR